MFYDTSCFPFVEELESEWETILSEYLNIKNEDLTPADFPYAEITGVLPSLSEKQVYRYRGEWDMFPFLFFDDIDEDRCKLCPKTWKLLKDLPGLKNAGFSILRRQSDIPPHTGFTNKVLRFHLGLLTPSNCLLVVDNEPRRWTAGKFLIFDDTKEHYAYNHNVTEDRVLLLLDFEKP